MNKKKYYVVGKGQRWEFNSVRKIFNYKSPLHPISFQDIGHNFGDSYFSFDTLKRTYITYVVYDYLFRVIRKEVLEQVYDDEAPIRSTFYKRNQISTGNYPGFRKGPIPHTGRNYYGFYNWYRGVKTTQELKWNCAHKNYTRGKRRNIRNAWDDVPRSDRRIKQSWKKQKKCKQWM